MHVKISSQWESIQKANQHKRSEPRAGRDKRSINGSCELLERWREIVGQDPPAKSGVEVPQDKKKNRKKLITYLDTKEQLFTRRINRVRRGRQPESHEILSWYDVYLIIVIPGSYVARGGTADRPHIRQTPLLLHSLKRAKLLTTTTTTYSYRTRVMCKQISLSPYFYGYSPVPLPLPLQPRSLFLPVGFPVCSLGHR